MNVCEHCLGTGAVLDPAGHHLVKCPECGGARAVPAADSAQGRLDALRGYRWDLEARIEQAERNLAVAADATRRQLEPEKSERDEAYRLWTNPFAYVTGAGPPAQPPPPSPDYSARVYRNTMVELELQRFRDWAAMVRTRDAEEEQRLERKAR